MKEGDAILNMIEIRDVTKRYGENKGIFDLSFNIAKGEVFGFLGPNGAGKTTAIRHLLGFLNPDKGTCIINGKDCRTHAADIQKELGYLPGEIAFIDQMTGTQFLKFMASMRRMEDFSKADDLLSYFELNPKNKIKKMSKGMKQKLGLVSAFMHDPEILILDEPTSGLDPLMQSKFVNLVLQEKRQGKTILMSSHSFEEVERTCDRVAIIRNGRLVATETVSVLKQSQKKTYRVTLDSPEAAVRFADEALDVMDVHDCVVTVSVSGDLTPFIRIMAGYHIIGLDVSTQSLEEIFMHYYGGTAQ